MTEILMAKTRLLQQVLSDLSLHLGKSRDELEKLHYELERQVQLSVDLCLDLSRHMLIKKGVVVPGMSREVFVECANQQIISRELAKKLVNATGLRNLIVHEYGVIDYDLFFGGLVDGYATFLEFLNTFLAIA